MPYSRRLCVVFVGSSIPLPPPPPNERQRTPGIETSPPPPARESSAAPQRAPKPRPRTRARAHKRPPGTSQRERRPTPKHTHTNTHTRTVNQSLVPSPFLPPRVWDFECRGGVLGGLLPLPPENPEIALGLGCNSLGGGGGTTPIFMRAYSHRWVERNMLGNAARRAPTTYACVLSAFDAETGFVANQVTTRTWKKKRTYQASLWRRLP